MSRLTVLLLFVSVTLTYAYLTSEIIRTVLVDSDNCVRLRCHWRGGEQCGAYKEHNCGLGFEPIKNKTDLEFFLHLKELYPLNTFTFDKVKMAKGCEEGKRLCCNVDRISVYQDFELNCEPQAEQTDFHPKKQQKAWRW